MTVDVVKGHNSRQLISFLASGDSCFLLITLIWVQTVCKGYQPGADPEGGTGGPDPPWKITSYMGFYREQAIGPPLENVGPPLEP